MGSLASPLEAAAIGAAILWPVAAGVAAVAWTKARKARRARRLAQLNRELQSLYRTVAARPVPTHLAMVIEALAEGEELAGGATAQKAGETTPADS